MGLVLVVQGSLHDALRLWVQAALRGRPHQHLLHEHGVMLAFFCTLLGEGTARQWQWDKTGEICSMSSCMHIILHCTPSCSQGKVAETATASRGLKQQRLEGKARGRDRYWKGEMKGLPMAITMRYTRAERQVEGICKVVKIGKRAKWRVEEGRETCIREQEREEGDDGRDQRQRVIWHR